MLFRSEFLLLQRRARLRRPVRQLNVVDLGGKLLDSRREEAERLGLDLVTNYCGATGEGEAGVRRETVGTVDGFGNLPGLCAEEGDVCRFVVGWLGKTLQCGCWRS